MCNFVANMVAKKDTKKVADISQLFLPIVESTQKETQTYCRRRKKCQSLIATPEDPRWHICLGRGGEGAAEVGGGGERGGGGEHNVFPGLSIQKGGGGCGGRLGWGTGGLRDWLGGRDPFATILRPFCENFAKMLGKTRGFCKIFAKLKPTVFAIFSRDFPRLRPGRKILAKFPRIPDPDQARSP